MRKGDRVEVKFDRHYSWEGGKILRKVGKVFSVKLDRDGGLYAFGDPADIEGAERFIRPEGQVASARAVDWSQERTDVLVRFLTELTKATGDGSKKRQAGTKPPWYIDQSHEGAIFSHLTKWKRGELVDPDSGAHPLVHLAWRALAIACQEVGNIPDVDNVQQP